MLGCGHDLKKFAIDILVTGTVLAQTHEQIVCLVLSAHRGKIARAIGKHLNEKRKDECRDTLKRQQEPPPNVGVSMIDKGQSERDPVSNGDSQI